MMDDKTCYCYFQTGYVRNTLNLPNTEHAYYFTAYNNGSMQTFLTLRRPRCRIRHNAISLRTADFTVSG